MKLRLLALTAGVMLANTQLASAAPNPFQDARSFAMGGTGVAASSPAGASFHNPALLAIKHEEKHDSFGLILPSVNGKFADDEEVVDQIDDIQAEVDRFNAAVAALNQPAVQASAARLRGQLAKLDNDTVRGDVGLGAALQIPNDSFSFGFFTDATVRATVRGDITEEDLAYLDSVIAGAPTGPIDTGNGVGQTLTSSGTALIGVIGEIGVSFAKAFDVNGNKLTVGVSPKFMQLRTYEYIASVASFDDEDFDADNFETEDSMFNLDLGTAYQFGADGQWIAGLSIRNVIPTDLKTIGGISMDVDPQATVGIAHTRDWHTVTVDLDLTENKAFGFEDDNQFISVGAEFDAFDVAQLRVGVRHNFGDSNNSEGIEEETQYTAGLGLSPFGVHFELSGLVSDTEYGAAVELGFTF